MTRSTRVPLYRVLDRLKHTPLHPQWIANRCHSRKLELIGTFAGSGLYVDIGVGGGDLSAQLRDAELLTLDYPKTAAAYAARPDVYADVQRLPLADASVDGVILFEVLEHVPNDDRAVAQISRVLKQDGVLFVSAPFAYPLHDAPHDYKRFSHYGLPALLEAHGLSVLATRLHGNSLTTAIQLVNLALLDTVKQAFERQRLLAWLLVAPAYLLCLTGNLLALPAMLLRRPTALVLGQTIVARKSAAGDG